MTVADDCLADLGTADLDAWDYEHATRLVAAKSPSAGAQNEAAREAFLLREASRPVVHFMISLPARGMPGRDIEQDATHAACAALSRRTVLVYRSAGLNAHAATRNLAVLDRVCALIGDWPDPAWTDAVRARVQGLLAARRAGRQRGEQLRQGRSDEQALREPSVPWLLCHPADHWFRRARPAIDDRALRAAIDVWIEQFAGSYATLAAGDWSSEDASADVAVELEVSDEIRLGPKEPVPTVVIAAHRGELPVGSRLWLRPVADPEAQFNGQRISVLPGERWHVCASLLPDGSMLPEDGSRRLGDGLPSVASAA